MELNPTYIIDKSGKPVSVIIPYNDFIEIIETNGLDLSEEEKAAIEQGIILRKDSKLVDNEYVDLNSI